MTRSAFLSKNKMTASRLLTASFFVLFALVCLGSVVAADITLSAPAESAVINPAKDSFSFFINSGESITQCDILIDGTIARTAVYDDVLKGRSLSFRISVPDGTHTWTAQCATKNNALLTTGSRTFVVHNEDASQVVVSSSGVTRGSMLYAFTMRNTADQPPVVLRKVAAGDFIEIGLVIEPSTIKRELYVKQKSAKNDESFIILTDSKSKKNYQLFQGKTVDIAVGTTKIRLQLQGFDGTRATLIATPFVSSASSNSGAEVTADSNAVDTDGSSTADDSTTMGDAITQEQGADVSNNGEEQETTPDATSTADETTTASGDDITTTPPANDTNSDAPKQGVLTRLLSWLASLFGA